MVEFLSRNSDIRDSIRKDNSNATFAVMSPAVSMIVSPTLAITVPAVTTPNMMKKTVNALSWESFGIKCPYL